MQEHQAMPGGAGHEEQSFYTPQQPVFDTAQDTLPVSTAPAVDGIEWQASEYVQHDKDAMWYMALALVAFVVAGGAIWFGSWTFAALIVAMAAALGFFAARPPRVIHYKLSGAGLQIGDKLYAFADFRSFGVLQEGGAYSVMLIATGRFLPPVPIYFAPENGEQIVDILGGHLPMQEFSPNPIDAIMRKLRF